MYVPTYTLNYASVCGSILYSACARIVEFDTANEVIVYGFIYQEVYIE
jgi:hypothetical protein